MASWSVGLHFPKLYWVEMTVVLLPVSVLCLSTPEVSENINMHKGNRYKCLTHERTCDMWPSPSYAAFYFSYELGQFIKETSAILVEFSKLVNQWLSSLFALNQVSDTDSQTGKEQHQITQVVPTSTGAVGMAAELFGRTRHNFA